jgi:hypothetical protein
MEADDFLLHRALWMSPESGHRSRAADAGRNYTCSHHSP